MLVVLVVLMQIGLVLVELVLLVVTVLLFALLRLLGGFVLVVLVLVLLLGLVFFQSIPLSNTMYCLKYAIMEETNNGANTSSLQYLYDSPLFKLLTHLN